MIVNFTKYDICARTRCWFFGVYRRAMKTQRKINKELRNMFNESAIFELELLTKILIVSISTYTCIFSLRLHGFFKHSTLAVIVVSIRLKFHALSITCTVFFLHRLFPSHVIYIIVKYNGFLLTCNSNAFLSGFIELQIQQDDNKIAEYTKQAVLIQNQYVQAIK